MAQVPPKRWKKDSNIRLQFEEQWLFQRCLGMVMAYALRNEVEVLTFNKGY